MHRERTSHLLNGQEVFGVFEFCGSFLSTIASKFTEQQKVEKQSSGFTREHSGPEDICRTTLQTAHLGKSAKWPCCTFVNN